MTSVWIINHYAIPSRYPGGTRHFELARRLVGRGYDVTIVASALLHATRTADAPDMPNPGIETIDGVRFVWMPARIAYRGSGSARIANMVEFAIRVWHKGRRRFGSQVPKPDIILGSSPHLLAALAAWRLARTHRSPFLLEIRDLWPETIVEMGVLPKKHVVTRLLYRLEKFLYARAWGIISLLPNIGEYLEKIHASVVPVTVISNGVDAEAFFCPSPPVSRDSIRIVYAGAHGPANGLECVREAALLLAHNPRIEFHFYGDGPMKAALVEAAQTKGQGNMQFHEQVPKHQMPTILCDADILLLNYAKIGIGSYGISPNKLWEYMATARPILFAHDAVNDPVAETGCGLTIPPGDPAALAEGIKSLVALSPAERAAMGQKGVAFVREKRDWDVLVERYAAAIDESLEKPKYTKSGRLNRP